MWVCSRNGKNRTLAFENRLAASTRHRQTVLAKIAAQLSEHQQGSDCALLYRSRQTQDLVPMRPNMFDLDRAAE